MKESTKEVIYIKTKITEKIIESLEDADLYICINTVNESRNIRKWYIKNNIDYYTHILLPKEISSADIEKEASMWFGWIERRINPETSGSDKHYIKFGMKELVKSALSIKETK